MRRILQFGLLLATLPCMGQIPSYRVLEIQKAMAVHGYKVKRTGQMDSQTIKAMRQAQKSNGWQYKIVPDSRLLIDIGLGPRYNKTLLNPNTAWVADVKRLK